MDEGKKREELIVVEDGELVLMMNGVEELFVNWYWDNIRWQIEHGYIEAGGLTWDDVTAMKTVMDVLAKGDQYEIPDDIIGAFAERGYGEFCDEQENNEESEEEANEE